MPYKVMTYESGSGPRAGIICGESAFDASDVTGNAQYASMFGVLEDWTNAKARFAEIAANAAATEGAMDLRTVRLLAPVPAPGAIYCAGANYRDQVAEIARLQNTDPQADLRSLGAGPWHFLKSAHCVVGPNSVVKLPAHSKEVDWEAELVVVIGRKAKDVPVESALDVVAGYTIGNDLSARDFIRRPLVPSGSPFHYDWLTQKCFDGSCPLGPWIVLAESVPDPLNLKIELTVNGALKQSSNTSQIIFTPAEQISHLSSRMTLYPGDVILTGTPAGVGMSRREFLKAGDEVRITIERLGALATTFV